MFKDGVPELPSGDGRLSFFKRCVWWAIWGGRFPFADSDTVKIEHTAGKYIFKAAPAGRAASNFKLSLYDTAKSYKAGEFVWVQASNTLTTTGAVYPPTGLTAMSVAGYWQCVRNAPAGIFPVAPYPTPDDPTDADMYFLFLGNIHCV